MIELDRQVAAVVEKDGKVLVQESERGISIPQARIIGDETDEQALERAIKEQSGLEITVRSLLAEGPDTAYYLCSPLVPNGPMFSSQDSHSIFVPRAEVVSSSNRKKSIELPPGVVLHLTGSSGSESVKSAEQELHLRIRPELMDEFEELYIRWERDSFSSSPQESQNHPAFRGIIAMGEPATPLILEKMRRDPSQELPKLSSEPPKSLLLYRALEEITGVNPVHETGGKSLEDIADDWLAWGEVKGHIKPLEQIPIEEMIEFR